MKLSVKNLLQNKIVLYVILFLSLTSMFSYLMAQNYAPILFFITVAFLTNNFSKNMIVVLGIALLSTNMLTSTTNVFSKRGFKEGMKHHENNEVDEDGKDDEDGDEEQNLISNIKKELHKVEKHTEKLGDKDKCGNLKNKSECISSNCEWDKHNSKCSHPVKSSFQNMNPASYPNADKSKPNLDQAGTTEAAYDHLENIMGTDSIRSMSKDTEKLVNRQKELIDQLKNIAPLINQTTKMISTFNMDGKLQGMIDGLTKNISSLNSSPQGIEDSTN